MVDQFTSLTRTVAVAQIHRHPAEAVGMVGQTARRRAGVVADQGARQGLGAAGQDLGGERQAEAGHGLDHLHRLGGIALVMDFPSCGLVIA